MKRKQRDPRSRARCQGEQCCTSRAAFMHRQIIERRLDQKRLRYVVSVVFGFILVLVSRFVILIYILSRGIKLFEVEPQQLYFPRASSLYPCFAQKGKLPYGNTIPLLVEIFSTEPKHRPCGKYISHHGNTNSLVFGRNSGFPPESNFPHLMRQSLIF